MQRYVTAFTIIGAWLIAAFILARVVIPSLINMHNDGAVILAIIIGFAAVLSPFFIWAAVKPIFQGDDQ